MELGTDSLQPTTILELLADAAARGGDTFCVRDAAQSLDASSLSTQVELRAAALRDLGVRRGDRVLIASDNSVQTVVNLFSVMRLGAIAAPINPEATTREHDAYVRVTKPRLVISATPEEWVGTATTDPHIAQDLSMQGETHPKPKGHERALILFTSGTTGMPKAAVHRHSTLVYAGQGLAHWLKLKNDDVLLLCMPLFHANGIFYSLMGGVSACATVSLVPRFSVSRFWDTVRSTSATQVNLLGPMLTMLLKAPISAQDRDHALRLVYTAGASERVLRSFEDRFGVTVVEGYGMSETPFGCINPLGGYRPSSVGLPRQHPDRPFHNEVRIVSPGGAVVPDGETGEIEIRNGAMLEEYWGNQEATDAAFHDGWLRTGDQGRRDADGYVYIVGRSKEIVRRKGVNIAPAEIEELLQEIPGVTGAALVGLPDDLGDEVAVAVVTVNHSSEAGNNPALILEQVRNLISREKWPDEVVVVDELPRTPTHRVEKGVLKEWLREKRKESQRTAPP